MLAYSTGGLGIAHWDGSSWASAQTASSTANYHLAQAKYDGTFVYVRSDSGSWNSTTKANVAGLSEASSPGVRIGANFNLSAFFDGRILEVMISQVAFADAVFDQIKSYMNTRYALAL
jgi:hypothetical protein